MAKGVYAALSGAVAAETALDTVAQNLANGSSEGYRKLRPVFREALAAAEERPGANRFTLVASTAIDTSPGVIKSTGRELDVVLPEGAFLAVSTDRGERFTRAGSIQIDATGAMRTGGGEIVDESGTPLRAPEGAAVSITPDGQVMADGQSLGRLRMVTFETPSALVPEGGALYASSEASGTPTVTDGELTVGAIEESNAGAVDAMTDMIKTTRLFDTYQRAIDAFFDLDRRITSSMSG
jgi:flagellar basal body rod protein FlgG